MKVRVEQIGELYYPWRNFMRIVGHEPYHETIKFDNLEEAKQYAKKFDNIIHEVN